MYKKKRSASNVSLLTYIVETIKTLKWIRVFQIDKRAKERGVFLGGFFIELWEFKE